MLALATMCVSAQSFGDVPATVDPNDVTILKKSVMVVAQHDTIVPNAKTGKMDTLKVRDGGRVFTPEEFEQLSKEPKRLRAAVVPGEQWGPDDGDRKPLGFWNYISVFLYTYKYPSATT